nr:hypothetical protein [Tanacetum cinerariifolium]
MDYKGSREAMDLSKVNTMVTPNYYVLLSGGVSTWGTRSLKSRVDDVELRIAINLWLLYGVLHFGFMVHTFQVSDFHKMKCDGEDLYVAFTEIVFISSSVLPFSTTRMTCVSDEDLDIKMIPQLVIILEGEICTSGNIVTNSCVKPSWREIVSLTFSKDGILHVNWSSLGHCDGDPVDPALNAAVLPKFDMHLYQSSLNETHFKWLVKCHVISKDLHPRIVPVGMTMDRLLNEAIGLYVYCCDFDIVPTILLFCVFYKLCKQGDWFSFQSMTGKNCKPCLKDAPMSLKKWKHKYFLVDRRAAPIAMAWRHHDSSKEASHVPILKGLNGKELTMAGFLCLPDLHGCKVVAMALLSPAAALETHLSTLNSRLEDISAKTEDMETAEVACRKVLADKEKKKRKVKAKAAAKANDTDDIHIERVVSKKRADGAGMPRKKRKTHVGALSVNMYSEHVSLPTPINHSLPVVAPANKEHVSETTSAAWLSALHNQMNELGSPLDLINKNVEELAAGEDRGNEHDDINFAIEGHGDNADGLFGLRTQLSPNNRSGHVTVKKPMCDTILVDVEASYSVGCFGNLPFTPQWGLTISSRIAHSRECQDMMSNLFTHADYEFLTMECRMVLQSSNLRIFYVSRRSNKPMLFFISRPWQKSMLILFMLMNLVKMSRIAIRSARKSWQSLQERVEELEEEKNKAEELNVKQADRIKHLEDALKQSEEDAHQLRLDMEKFAVKCGEVSSLTVGKGFIDGLSVDRRTRMFKPSLKQLLVWIPHPQEPFWYAFATRYGPSHFGPSLLKFSTWLASFLRLRLLLFFLVIGLNLALSLLR